MNITDTLLYKEYAAQQDEIMKHKWYESERAGYDIGFIQAVIDWTIKYKSEWYKKRKNKD